jgi:hypothetical protein
MSQSGAAARGAGPAAERGTGETVNRESKSENPAGEPLLQRLERLLSIEPKPLPGARALRTTLRTVHVLAFATLYGGHVYNLPPDRLLWALVATVATGAVFLAFEIYSAPVYLVEMRGLATVVKLVLVAAVAVFWEARVALLSIAIVIGVVASHMPGRYRYFSLLHGRVVETEGQG